MIALGTVLLEARKLEEARELLGRAMQLAPQAAEPVHLLGQANYLLKNYDGAVALLQRATKIDSGNPFIYKRLGQAYRAVGRPQDAASAFQRYLDLAPDAPDREEIKKLMRN